MTTYEGKVGRNNIERQIAMSEKPSENPSSLRRNVNMLGTLLGDVIRDHKGEDFFNKIESIRQLSPKLPAAMQLTIKALTNSRHCLDLLHSLPDDELVPVVRSFRSLFEPHQYC